MGVPSFILLFSLANSLSAFNVTRIDHGIAKHEMGIVITNLRIEPRLIKITFPRYANLLPTLFDNISMADAMRDGVIKNAQRIGAKYDRHIKTTLLLWHQEITHKPVSMTEIQMYWNERKIRPPRFVDPISLSIASYASVVATSAQGMAIWNRASIDKMGSRIDDVYDFAQKSHKTMESMAGNMQVTSDQVEILFNKTNDMERNQHHILELMLMSTDVTVGLAIYESTINDELEQLRIGRLPTKLLNDDILKEIGRESSNRELAMPLRLIKTTVTEIDAENLSITVRAEVPIMKTLQYFPKYKVENVGFSRMIAGCTLFKSTPNFVAKLPEGFRPIDEEYCNVQSDLIMLCSSGAFNNSALHCTPMFDTSVPCDQKKVCGLQAIIKSTPAGYLVNFKKEILIMKENMLLFQTVRYQESYCIALEPKETLIVDGSSITSDNRISHSTLDFSILAETVEEKITDFSSNIRNMKTAQLKMNVSLSELGQHPVITGGRSWFQSFDTWKIVSLVLISAIIVTLMGVGICYWFKCRGKGETGSAPAAPAPPSTIVQLAAPAPANYITRPAPFFEY